ncbi:alpha-amylase [Rhodococcus sp. BP-252]|nr:alpha-amylase [Rhodococcus sp. BP-320]MBY6417315.1 alpha-amylase [Rhodococcus sp. BP-321]MBY6421900.1 alpha-amylase [Rhodococcus sp. BP-324]MBY6427339.1 alpha-amylase [Rhodococcus sp. BP-323]MBY6432518.1 alpha-amylase [Rhodococcus sp. BP-322]MBY6441328.1 alpha-amylase [Rhodococcus sp. BP-319]MBY6445277.1 alpha-amylase [Rhodococcus sp. BP-318]MBY6450452.1 alpha-amylase [Rhodococcus sp. BP-315]MBY6454755.1 alpha-amylase [Rhodococcus sp. BP-277]MBY6461116.1 alpha-amylase [Rhodococcus sp. B
MIHDVALPETARRILADLPDHRRATFELRLERWWPDLHDAVTTLYSDPDDVAAALVTVAARGFVQRPDDLHRLDDRRLLQPDWFQRPDMFGYACYVDRYAETLKGMGDRLGHLTDLGVTYLHLMPLLKPRPGDNDGGYAVMDYRSVRPDLGTNDDLRDLATTLRGKGISLVVDLVLNHVAREHDWAVKARAGDASYRDWFHIYPDRATPDAFEATLPEVFPDFAPGNFTFDDELGQWVWTTFNEWQWDLNWSNPAVLLEFADVVIHLANLGVEVLRLDAIAFLWKRLGTNCQNQPEVHAITQALRATARIAAPATLFKAEAIVGPRDLLPYLGLGRHTGKVSDIAYHNSLMVHVWSMLASGSADLARHALGSLPPTPPSGTWVTYVRCHDDIGWAIDDGDAAGRGITGAGHRHFLADWYSGEFEGSWAEGVVFQHNPATGDRRISGTAAGLTGLGPSRKDPDGAFARIFLAHAIVAAWGGIPVVWSGDEIGSPGDVDWASEPGHEDDNRWIHRPRVTDTDRAGRVDEGSDAQRVFDGIARIAAVRAGLPMLHAEAPVEVLSDVDDGVLAIARRHPSGTLVGLFNVTCEHRPFPGARLRELGVAPREVLSQHELVESDGLLWIPPYAAWWIV